MLFNEIIVLLPFQKGLGGGGAAIFKMFLCTKLNAIVSGVGNNVTESLLCLYVLLSTNPFNLFDTSTLNKMIINKSRPTENQVSESSGDHQHLFPCFTCLSLLRCMQIA